MRQKKQSGNFTQQNTANETKKAVEVNCYTLSLISVRHSETKSRDATSKWNECPQFLTHAFSSCQTDIDKETLKHFTHKPLKSVTEISFCQPIASLRVGKGYTKFIALNTAAYM